MFPLNAVLDCENRNRIKNLAQATANGEPVTFEQLNNAVEGVAWKDSVRVRAPSNVNLAAPGASLDGITMAANDRFLAPNQTTTTQNGIYIWNGSAVAATRALDASTFAELEAAVLTVEEGTSAGTTYRQTAVNGVIGTDSPVFTTFGTSAPSASETTAGIAEIATQGEADTGTDDTRFMTPLKAKTASWMLKKYSATIGDNAATSIVVTHNLNTTDIQAQLWEVGGSKRNVICEVQATSVNTATFLFDVAPTNNQYRAVIMG